MESQSNLALSVSFHGAPNMLTEFGGHPTLCLGETRTQTNKQTDRLAFVYIYIFGYLYSCKEVLRISLLDLQGQKNVPA